MAPSHFNEANYTTSTSSQYKDRCNIVDLWFDDGDVILSSRVAEHQLLFRVHAEVLSANSTVLRHRIENLSCVESCSGPCAEEGASIDIPVVELPEDGDYWCYFLRALYRGSRSASQHR